MTLSIAVLLVVMPRLLGRHHRYSADAMLPALNSAMRGADITTALRTTHFLAQLAHESIELTVWEERPWVSKDGRRYPDCYEGRADLGNIEPGDGARYHGRGPLQLTGRSNYRHYGQVLGLPLETHPELALALDVGFRVAAAYWGEHHLNELADLDDIEGITRRINGGVNGLKHRKAYLARAIAAIAEPLT